MFVNVSENIFEENILKDQELEESVNSLKKTCQDLIRCHFFKFCSGDIFHPLKHIADISLQTGTFPNSVEVARV